MERGILGIIKNRISKIEFSSIKSKAAAFVAALVIILLLFESIVLIYTLKSTITDKQNESFKNSAKQAESLVQDFDYSLEKLRESKLQDYDKQIKNIVDTAISIANANYTQGQGKDKVISILRSMRYGNGNSGYIFIMDSSYRLLLHPIQPNREGENWRDMKDANGKLLSKDMVDGALKEGTYYSEYVWPKPGFTEPQPKRTYTAYFKPWNWVIGTGNYIDDINSDINKEKDKLFGGLKNSLSQVKIGENGRPIIIDGKGKVIIDPAKVYEGKNVNEIGRDSKTPFFDVIKEGVKENKTIEFKSSKPGSDKAYKTLGHIEYNEKTNWYIMLMAYDDEVYNDVFWAELKAILILLISIGIGSYLSVTVSRKFVAPLDGIMENMAIAATGDLRVKSEVSSNDEMGKLAQSFNKMIESQRRMAASLNDSSNKLGKSSSELNDVSAEISNSSQNQAAFIEQYTEDIEELGQSMEQVANDINLASGDIDKVSTSVVEIGKTIQETARNVEDATIAVNKVSTAIGEMGESIEKISRGTIEARDEAHNTVQTAKDGLDTVRATMTQMDNVINVVNNLSETIKGLGSSAGKINEIVDVIKEIAGQTNLLSLNAEIEAARAGEAGKGFEVVANAIRTLAEQSAVATKDISNLIRNIQQDVRAAISVTNDGEEQIKLGVQYVKDTENAFEKIYTAINSNSDIIEGISLLTKKQEEGSKDIIEAANVMNQLIHQLSATTQEQAASTDEIIDAIERVTKFIHEVAETAKGQIEGSRRLIGFMKSINEGVSEVSSSSEEMSTLAFRLDEMAKELVKLSDEFRV